MKSVIVYGAGGHASVVAEAIVASGDKVVGYVDDIHPERKGEVFRGVPILGGLDDLYKYLVVCNVEVAIGFGDCMSRMRLHKTLKKKAIRLTSVIHPRAVVSSHAKISEGVYIGPYAIVEADCIVGACSIINCGANVCHGTIVGDYASICPGVNIGGNCHIGNISWVGIGTTIIEGITIGEGCYIGAGSVVVGNMPVRKKIYGVPAKVVCDVQEKYLL